jgi:hypothetical protein
MDQLDQSASRITAAEQLVVCPNCGNQQAMSGVDSRCDRCGMLLNPAGSGKEGIVGGPIPGRADPAQVPPPMASGGIGGVNDGTQVTRHTTSPVPGKPAAPITSDPAGSSTLEGQALDTPASGAHAERGGSG